MDLTEEVILGIQSDEMRFYRNSDTVPAQYKLIDIRVSTIEHNLPTEDKEDGIHKNINENFQQSTIKNTQECNDTKVIENDNSTAYNSNSVNINFQETYINEKQIVDIENSISLELQNNELKEQDYNNISQECDQTKSESYLDEMTETTIDESSKNFDIQVDNDSRFYFGNAIPTLVYFSCQTFQDSCTKGCTWSPDGEKLLVAAEDARYRIFPLTKDLLVQNGDGEIVESVVIKETEMIYHWVWCPDNKILSTGRYQPIHLWDSDSGQLVDSYKCFDHVDEITSAYSLALIDEADSFVAGLKNEIRMFRLSRPGREYQSVATTSNKDPEKLGIVSSLAYCGNTGLIAAGSYNKTIAIFHLNAGYRLYTLTGHHGGITQVKFSDDGTRLYSGARKDDQIFVWDTRSMQKPMHILHRAVSTNQRIEFDVVRDHVVSGGSDGVIRVWDHSGDIINGYMLHPDSIPGCSVHPTEELLATCSGQRHADNSFLPDIQDSPLIENSVKIWNFGKR